MKRKLLFLWILILILGSSGSRAFAFQENAYGHSSNTFKDDNSTVGFKGPKQEWQQTNEAKIPAGWDEKSDENTWQDPDVKPSGQSSLVIKDSDAAPKSEPKKDDSL